MMSYRMLTRLALGAVVMAGLGACSQQEAPAPASAVTADAALIAQGAYLARAGDCVACHTAKGGTEFAGGLAMASPMGTIYSTNITPDAEHGIGNYTELQFSDAVRKGIRRDGARLYPAMPYPDYQAITDADIHALYAYFMKGVKPVAKAAPETDMSFPFNQRWGMRMWNAAFTNDRKFSPDPKASDELNRGKYLVETLGHCGSCHTPRGVAMQQKALEANDDQFLAGGEINDWPVPSLRGVGRWSADDVVGYLQNGRNAYASVGGEMTDVVEHSTQHLTDADLRSVALYLKSLPADEAAVDQATLDAASKKTTEHLAAARDLSEGGLLYLNNCEACHWTDGRGAAGIFPRLDGGSLVQAENPYGLIHVVLAGAKTPSTQHAPSIMAMPGFKDRLTDKEVADLATFLRAGWSNKAPSVSEKDVEKVRAKLAEGAGH